MFSIVHIDIQTKVKNDFYIKKPKFLSHFLFQFTKRVFTPIPLNPSLFPHLVTILLGAWNLSYSPSKRGFDGFYHHKLLVQTAGKMGENH